MVILNRFIILILIFSILNVSIYSQELQIEEEDSIQIISNTKLDYLVNTLLSGTKIKNKKRKQIYKTTDIILLSLVGYSIYQSNKYLNIAVEYGEVHSGIPLDNKSIEFLDIVSRYNSLISKDKTGYNDYLLLNYNSIQLYPINEKYFWKWDSEASRLYFKELIKKYREYKVYSYFFIGGLILNRFISNIDLYFSTRNLKVELKKTIGN